MTVRNVNDNQIVGDPLADLNRQGNVTVGDPLASLSQVGSGSATATRTPANLSMDSDAAKKAIQTSLNYLGSTNTAVSGLAANPGREVVARSVFTDELGMTHVRMDRVYNGLPVWGQQVITHLGADGQVK